MWIYELVGRIGLLGILIVWVGGGYGSYYFRVGLVEYLF